MKPFPLSLSRLFATLLALGCLAAASAQAPRSTPGPGDTVGEIKLSDASLDDVLGILERYTGKVILRPQALPAATITLRTPANTSRDEAIQAIETLLNLNGIALTPLGEKFIKVTAINVAKSEAPELIDGSTLLLPPSGRLAAKIFQLNFLRVGEFMPQMAALLSPNTGSPPVVFEKANAALITDSVSNLQRIETLIARLDQPALSGLSPKFYTLHFAKASDVVNKMRTILSGPLQTQLGTATSYNADDRTNQIVVISDPRQIPFFDDLIGKLDVKSDPNTRNDVIYLKHATAKDVASILSQLVTGQNNASRQQEGSARPTVTGVTPAVVQGPNNTTVTAPAAPATVNLTGIEPSNQFSSLLTILPEERSNSIVVSGTVDDIRLINELVAKIDVLLAQVRIEVVIAEVTLNDEATSGISALGLKISGDKLVGGQISLAGAVANNVTATIQPTGDKDLAAEIGLSATPRKSNATILSVPNIMTTHNKEGEMFVGEQRPTISSYLNDGATTGGTSTLGGYRSTVSSKDIGISLKVKPLIGNDGSVQLEVTQEVNDILGDITIDGNPQPRIGRRSTKSFVSVRSGEIIVLGGLQRTSKSKSTSRLGPIPILGDLLGTRKREDNRTDLVFFLRPTVLGNTAADNAPALKQIEALPSKQRDPILDAIGQPLPDPKKKR